MDGIGNQLLARSALAVNQDCGITRSDQGEGLKQLSHWPALADDSGKIEPVGEALFEENVFLVEMVMVQRFLDKDFELLDIQGFGQIIVSP